MRSPHPAGRFGLALLALVVAILVPLRAIDGDTPQGPVATVAKPAELPAKQITRVRSGQPPRTLNLSVVDYTPPREGTVAAVVTLANAHLRIRRDLGRFGVYPNAPFTAEKPDDAQRFGFQLAPEDVVLLQDAGTQVVVSLEPSAGARDGARLVLGAAELR